MSVKVSVVVPVHNPGPAIEPCIASLVGQSLPADRYEVIFVDDGSTDDTPARLDEVAAAHANVRVTHIPPSGAPGRPRNVGLGMARGEYVHFVDADDALAPRALEWLTGMADRYGSDVVIGKYASATLERSQVLFTHNRPRCSLADTEELLTASWAPAKLFRTAVLRERGILFPEGWRWLEDQLFLLRAYLAARNISVFSDEVCYFFVRRDEGGHLSSEDLEPESHVAHLGEVFDVIESETPPGPLRERLLRRFYRANILSRLDRRYLAASPEFRARTFESFHRFVTDRVATAIDEAFAGANRVRSRFLRSGDAAGLLAFTRRLESLELHAEITSLRWAAGRLVLGARGELRSQVDGEPLILLVRDGRTLLDPALTGDVGELVDAEIDTMWARVSLIEPTRSLEWIVPAPFAPVLTDAGEHPAGGRRSRPALVASVEIDPERIGPGKTRLAPGRWAVTFRWRGLGLAHAEPLRRVVGDRRSMPVPAVLGDPARLVVPRHDADGLTVEVGGQGIPDADWPAIPPRVLRDGRRLEVALPLVSARGTAAGDASIVLRLPAGDRTWPADAGHDLGRLRLRSTSGDFGSAASQGGPTSAAASAATDDAPLVARLGSPLGREVPLGRARLDGAGGLRVTGFSDPGVAKRTWRRAAWVARSAAANARAALRERAIDVTVRLPHPVRRVLIAAYRTARNRGGRTD